uniref:Uncharacterized protein n=1 Tax=Arundo donax TaxID=35708 RepID=A0A0A9A3N2_ARUDO
MTTIFIEPVTAGAP